MAPTVQVLPGAFSLAKSTISVSAPTFASGTGITVTLQAADAVGNKLTTGGLTVGFGLGSVNGGQGKFSAVTDKQNGTYTATLTGTTAGNNTVTATIGGQAVTSTTPAISVTVGAASVATSLVTLSSGNVTSGNSITVKLQAFDGAGNKVTTGGLGVTFSVGSQVGAQGTFSAVTDNKNGTYTATFTGTLMGTNTITAKIGAAPLTSVVPTITVGLGALSLAKSYVSLSAPAVAVGSVLTVTLQATDAAGNKFSTGGLNVAFALGSANGGQGLFISTVNDNNDGTYSAIFAGTTVGTNTVTSTIGGVAVTSPAPTLNITAGAPSLANSIVTLSAPTVASGSAVTATLQTVDSLGNLIKIGGAQVQFNLGGGNGQGTFGTVKDNGNGTYTATLTGTTAGVNTVTATIGNQPITTPAPSITVTAGPASLANSFVTLSSQTVVAGNTVTALLQTFDGSGNQIKTGGLTVVFTMGSAGGAQGTFSATKDNGNGTYTATFSGTTAGVNTITAKIANVTLTSSAPSITVTPGAMSLATTGVSLSSSSIPTGSSVTATVQAKDAFGNKISTGGSTVALLLGSVSGGQVTIGPVTDNNNGTYTASVTGTTMGTNSLKATVGGQAVTSAPAAFTVTPSVSKSFVTLSAGTLASGSAITITLTATDGAGTKLKTGGDIVVFTLGSPNGGKGSFGAVTDNKNGTYTATFTGTIAGANTITATIDGQALTSTAPTVTITPGPLSLAKSTVTLAYASVVGNGGTNQVKFQAADAAGNKLTTGGAAVSFALGSSSGGKGTFSAVTDNNDGTYSATFTAGASGTNTIVGKVGASALTSAAPTITITAAASLNLSKVLLSAGTVALGNTITVTLQTKDGAGNNLTAGGLNVTFTLASPNGGQGTLGTVVDNHDGTYTVSFLATAKGSNNIRGFIGGGLVTSGAPIITII
ncbi:MAG: hypothetical protein JSS02_22455 [Planctomycetes bacterium]|nr:hypothetical protein [Planctomycetota bacterium]